MEHLLLVTGDVSSRRTRLFHGSKASLERYDHDLGQQLIILNIELQ